MLNLTVRFTGPESASIETMEVAFSGSQVAAVTQGFLGYPGHEETVRERNYRLRASAQKIGAMLSEQICKQLRSMGHAV